jgi:hypothetical protein
MPSTGPTTIAGPPSVIVQASLESGAFRIGALTRLVPWPVPNGAARRSDRYPGGVSADTPAGND